jgi:hypothetical protein
VPTRGLVLLSWYNILLAPLASPALALQIVRGLPHPLLWRLPSVLRDAISVAADSMGSAVNDARSSVPFVVVVAFSVV